MLLHVCVCSEFRLAVSYVVCRMTRIHMLYSANRDLESPGERQRIRLAYHTILGYSIYDA